MKRRTGIMLLGLWACLCFAGISEAQTGKDIDPAYTLSNFRTEKPAANIGEKLIIRNRLDSGACWTASGDVMFMTRSGGKTSSLLINADGSGAELFNSKDFKFPWAASPRVSIVGEDILFGCDVEASFFNIDGWESARTEVAPEAGAYFMLFDNLSSSFSLSAGDVVNYRYTSLLRSSEINLRHSCSEMISVLAGFRYVELHEDLVATVNDVDYVDANVDNHLYGAQIGLNAAFINLPRLSIEGVLKAGVFGNHTDLTMLVRDRGLYGDKTTHTAVLGEIGLMGIVQVTNSLALRGGYQAMWLDGIAIAGDQYENLNPSNPKPYVGGTLFYHGAFAGLEFAF